MITESAEERPRLLTRTKKLLAAHMITFEFKLRMIIVRYQAQTKTYASKGHILALGSADVNIPADPSSDVQHKKTELYDTIANSWTTITEYPFSTKNIYRYSVTFIKDAFYVFGGKTESWTDSNAIVRLDNAIWSWSKA